MCWGTWTDDLLAGEQRRRQIRVGLAGTGTGLDHEDALVRQRVRHRTRHFELGSAGPEAGNMLGKPSTLAEDGQAVEG